MPDVQTGIDLYIIPSDEALLAFDSMLGRIDGVVRARETHDEERIERGVPARTKELIQLNRLRRREAVKAEKSKPKKPKPPKDKDK